MLCDVGILKGDDSFSNCGWMQQQHQRVRRESRCRWQMPTQKRKMPPRETFHYSTDACRLVTCVGGCSRTPTRTSSLLFIRKDGRGMTPTACAHVSNFPANFRHSTFARRPHNIKNFSISTKPSPCISFLLLLSIDSHAE